MSRPMPPSERISEQGIAGPHLDEDRALDLLLDLLPEWEVEAIGSHLASCGRCEDLLRQRGALLERRRAAPEATAMLASLADPEGSAGEEPAFIERRRQRQEGEGQIGGPWRAVGSRSWLRAFRRPVFALGLGGAVLAVVAIVLLTANPKKAVLLPTTAEWLPSASETLNLRNEATRQQVKDLAFGLRAYDRRELSVAIRALSAARTTDAMETLRLVFLGSALTRAGEYARAVQALRSCPLQRIPEPWHGEAHWTLLVALHGAGDDAAADSLLRVLADEKGAIGGRARLLLGRPDP